MLRSRVLSGIDTARLANAVARPGIDPRVWVSYAVLTTDPQVVTEADEEDVIVDIMLLPSGTVETARVGAAYAGNGFGLYAPLHKDDEVLVAAPSGDPDEGLVVIQRLWSPADKPPSLIQQHPHDWTLVVESGRNMRLNVQGGGNVYLVADAGKVFLGGVSGTEPVAKGTSLKSYLESIADAFNNHTHIAPSGGGATGTPPASTPPRSFAAPTNAILATKTEVK